MKFLLVGLGNVGNEYANTRHNIGFDVLNAFVHKHNASFAVERLAYVANVGFKGKKITCVCPTTFMNLSGKAFKYWQLKANVPNNQTLTVVDDLSLPLEKIRIRPNGTHAGHNGLRDIEAILQTDAYPKLRFGIGNQFPKGMQVPFVLGRWKPEELPLVQYKIQQSVEAIEMIILQGIQPAMNKYNNISFDVKDK